MVQRMTKRMKISESIIRSKLTAYSSDQSNSCIEKSDKLACLPIQLLPTADDFVLRAQQLEAALKEDLSRGLIPTMCIATLGTTGTCAYDDIKALVQICQHYQIWLHVDVAYAGAALALDEYAHLHDGLHDIDTLNINLHKLVMVNYDCAVMWLKDARKLVETLQVNRIYIENNEKTNKLDLPGFRNWQISLELEVNWQHGYSNGYWTVKEYMYMVQSIHCGKIFLRFVIRVCGTDTKEEDVNFAWTEIQSELSEMRVIQEELKIPDGIAKCKSTICEICLESLRKRKSLNLGDMYLFNSSEKYK